MFGQNGELGVNVPNPVTSVDKSVFGDTFNVQREMVRNVEEEIGKESPVTTPLASQ